jgi:DNA polymerase-3 subunit alpha
MIAECKRIRTKKGDMMMFATLDDLEGQCEILVFNSAYQSNADKIDVDKLIVVRGRVDHKDQGETKVVVQEVTPFEPTDQEIEKARAKMAELDAKAAVVHQVRVKLDGQVAATVLDDLKDLIGSHKGERDLVLVVDDRVLILGPEFRVSGSANCLQDLKDTVAGDGDVALREVEAPFSAAVPEPVASSA